MVGLLLAILWLLMVLQVILWFLVGGIGGIVMVMIIHDYSMLNG